MAKPMRNAVLKHPQALILKEWPPNQRVQFDYEWFDSTEHLAEWFDNWCEDSAEAGYPIVVAEVVDTARMVLGRVTSLPVGDEVAAARRAEVVADPSLLLYKRRPKVRANISWITETLATGGDFAHLDDVMLEQLNDLLGQDLALVIDCRVEDDDTELWRDTAETWKAPTYLHLPTNDAEGWSIPPEHFDLAVDAAAPVLERGGRVFVHCHMGVNRGPSTAYAVLLSRGYSATEAFDMIRAARPVAGIAYAEDAVRWWAERDGWSTAKCRAVLKELDGHVSAVLGPKESRVIEHAIRSMTDSDRRQIECAQL